MSSPLPPLALALGTGPQLAATFPLLEQALAGRGRLLMPFALGEAVPAPSGALAADTGVGGVAVGTSGSTGTPKRAVLPGAALRASVAGTEAVLGGSGRWLLLLPPHHIGGLQVLLRSLAAGWAPGLPTPEAFTAASFRAAVRALPGAPRRYTSLVPTQLARVLDDPGASADLAGFDAVLVGGAAIDPRLLAAARAAGVRVVTTYGMSETAGGCVYDGAPLPDVAVRIGPDGRVHLGGPTLARGYLDPRADHGTFETDHRGRRWFRTDDLGRLDDDGRLVVDGRVDDVIATGGLKVWPGEVERALLEVLPGGCEAAVVGVPDPQWGQCVAAVIACGRPVDLAGRARQLRASLRERLPAHAVPRLVRVVAALPLRGPGKPDRAALRALFDPPGATGNPTPRRDDAPARMG